MDEREKKRKLAAEERREQRGIWEAKAKMEKKEKRMAAMIFWEGRKQGRFATKKGRAKE